MIALLLSVAMAGDNRVDLVSSGDPGAKIDIVFVAEGFTADDMDDFRTYTDDAVRELFGAGPLGNAVSAFNVSRLEIESDESGTGEVRYETSTGNGCTGTLVLDADKKVQIDSSSPKDTAFGMSTNCRNDICWFTNADDTQERVDDVLAAWAPEADKVLVIMNSQTFGGCSGSFIQLTASADATVIRHELGHLVADLADEYISSANPGNYTGGEPGRRNVTATTATLKWSRWVDPSTPVPTAPNLGQSFRRVGAFEGATPAGAGSGVVTGVWRPTLDSTMNNNLVDFNAVGYTAMMEAVEHEFARPQQVLVGDFTGDGTDDVFAHRGSQIDLYQGGLGALSPVLFEGRGVPGWGAFLPGDHFLVGDFDDDGKDDLYVFNTTDYTDQLGDPYGYAGMLRSTGTSFELVALYDGYLPGWGQLLPDDRFQVGDFDGDGRADLVAFNGTNRDATYLGLIRSTGAKLTNMRRYRASLTGWQLSPNDKLHVGDFDGDGRDDLALQNTSDWSVGYLAITRSFSTRGTTGLQVVKRFDGTIPVWDAMLDHDEYYVADANGDGRDDLYLWNPDQWDHPYLGVLNSEAGGATVTQMYAKNVFGWTFHLHDEHVVTDIDGNGADDLVVWNPQDWSYPYLGRILSGEGDLTGAWHVKSIGEGTAAVPRNELNLLYDVVPANLLQGSSTELVLWSRFELAIPFLGTDVTYDGYGTLQFQNGKFLSVASYPGWVANFEYEVAGMY